MLNPAPLTIATRKIAAGAADSRLSLHFSVYEEVNFGNYYCQLFPILVLLILLIFRVSLVTYLV